MIDSIVLATPITSLIVALIIVLLSIRFKDKNLFDIVSVIGSLIVFIEVLYAGYHVLINDQILVYGSGGWLPPLGIVYIVDKLSCIMALVTSLIIFLVILYSISYRDIRDDGLPYYYTLLFLLEAALIGIYYTGDFFNLFVMIELMAVAAYALVAYHRRRGRAIEASLKYGIIAAVAGILFFVGLGFTYAYLGTLSMPDISAKIMGIDTPMNIFSGSIIPGIPSILLIAGLIIWSFMIESAVFPIHFWLPDAHSEAPSPVSAVLSGLVVNAGLYAIIRLVYTLYGGIINTSIQFQDLIYFLNILACIGAFYASIMMLIQNDVKRLIAYSTVLHVSLILVATTLLTRLGLSAGIYHFITHSLSKSLAFLSVGLLIFVTGTRRIDSLRGLAREYPLVGAATIISMLGLAGIPPIGTFPSKLLMVMACVAKGNIIAGGTIVVTSAIAAIGYFRIINLLINQPSISTRRIKLGFWTRLTILLLTILVVVVGIIITPISSYTYGSATQLFDPRTYVESVKEIMRQYGIGW